MIFLMAIVKLHNCIQILIVWIRIMPIHKILIFCKKLSLQKANASILISSIESIQK